MKPSPFRNFAGALALLGLLASGVCAAAEPSDEAPPSIAGRLTVVEGEVQVWRTAEDGSAAWDTAQPNDVVTRETGLYTGRDGRAEVRVGPNAFRLGPSSRGGFAQLDDTTLLFNLETGVLNTRVAQGEAGGTIGVTAGGTRIDLAAPGRYRVDAAEGGGARVTTFEGQASLRNAGNVVTVGAGHSLDFAPQMASFSYGNAVTTGFDAWSAARDTSVRAVVASQYVSPWMTGAEDLDRYGDWNTDPTYGTVWIPRQVAVGWTPYRDGQWRWVAPWGWTWVDAAPWGFAPFHYGRWVTINGRWGWWPGAYTARPVYAPALVGFVGKPGWSVTVGVGGAPYVGWYPLAPWHEYRPAYTVNRNYVTVINRNVIGGPPRGIRPDNNFEHGRTVVPGDRFAHQPINRVALPPQRSGPIADLHPVAPPRGFPPRGGERSNDFDRRVPAAPAPAPSPNFTGGRPGGAPAFDNNVPRDGRGNPQQRGEPPVNVGRPAPGSPSSLPVQRPPEVTRGPAAPANVPAAEIKLPRTPTPSAPQGSERFERHQAMPADADRAHAARPVQPAPRPAPQVEAARPAPRPPEAAPPVHHEAPPAQARPAERAERPAPERAGGERRMRPE